VTDSQVPRRALPNDLPPEELHLRRDSAGTVRLDPERAGWRYLSFESIAVGRTGASLAPSPDAEVCLVVISGRGLQAEAGGARWRLEGRNDPFSGLPSALWLPTGTGTHLVAPDGDAIVAIARAPRSGRDGVASSPIAIGPADIRVEVRGAGNATRQINHIIAPEFPADRLEVVEVLTPSGNWSSWPPHKHDVDDMPSEAVLEEIYHYRFRRPQAWGIQRVYRVDRSRDGIWEVRDGDVVIVPDGYHPFTATHGDDAYYLNALAGDRRTMACSFDPDLDWVREAWASIPADPRVPMVPPAASVVTA
jgi:5-deoxy-glucuronate isomerase